jgi:ceramide glucosyltransferase
MSYLHIALLIPSVLALLALLLQHIAAWRFFARRSRRAPAGATPSIAIIAPVRGLDQGAAQNFSSLLQQGYPGEQTVIFAVEDRNDPAVPVIQAALRRHDHGRLVWSDAIEGPARGKVRNLLAGYRASRSDIVAFVDSDVRLPPTFLDDVAAALAEPGVGLAFAVPVCEGAADAAAAMHNLLVNASALHYAASAQRGRLNAAVGSAMALRRSAIEQIGGLERIADRAVGVDVALGEAVRGVGFRIAVLRQPARIFHAHDSPRRLWWQVHRWLVTIRSYYPAAPMFLLLAAFPLAWSLLFLTVALRRRRYVWLGAGMSLLALAVHLASAALINARLSRDKRMWRYLWLAALAELFQLPILAHSMVSSRVLWRGRWLRVERRGRGAGVKA